MPAFVITYSNHSCDEGNVIINERQGCQVVAIDISYVIRYFFRFRVKHFAVDRFQLPVRNLVLYKAWYIVNYIPPRSGQI